MKNILKFIVVTMSLLWATIAQADITSAKFSTAQVFDVQYYWSGSTLNVSGLTRPFRSVPSVGQLSTTYVNDMAANNRTFGFFDSTTNPGTYGFAVYNSDGSVYEVLHNTGTFSALGDGAIFYLGDSSWGTVISTAQGLSYGDSATFQSMTQNPTNEQIAAYTPASTTPLAAGETASAPSAPTPVYLSSITQIQQAQKDTAFAVTTGNNVDLTIVGSSNDVDITQLSDGNYLYMYLQGSSNVTAITQSGTNLDRNFADINIAGSSNNLTFTQQGDSEKTAFLDIDGSFSTYTITQQGSGEHYLDLTSVGDSATVTVLQEGLGSHSATVELTNAGGNWNFNLTQSGDVDQLYSLPHNLSDNTVVSGTCTSGTCNMTINQQ